MKHGKFEKILPAAPKMKKWTLILCLVLLVSVGVGATIAYFHLSSTPVINIFQAGTPGAEIVETVNDNTKEAIFVKNTGKSPVYVRVRLVSYYEDAAGNVLAQDSPAVTFTPGEKWKLIDGYYYYTAPLAANSSTDDLLDSNVAMEAGQVIEVLADTVQATPPQAAFDTWGVNASAFIAD